MILLSIYRIYSITPTKKIVSDVIEHVTVLFNTSEIPADETGNVYYCNKYSTVPAEHVSFWIGETIPLLSPFNGNILFLPVCFFVFCFLIICFGEFLVCAIYHMWSLNNTDTKLHIGKYDQFCIEM